MDGHKTELVFVIDKIVNVQRHTAESLQAGHVVFVIITDGLENASKRYTTERIKQIIAHQKKKYGWEFIFLGANIDAVAAATRAGIDHSRTANFHADPHGIRLNYEVIERTVTSIRAGQHLSEDWKDEIDEDYKKRDRLRNSP